MELSTTLLALPRDLTGVSFTLTQPLDGANNKEDTSNVSKNKSSSSTKWVIIVLDNSGSMSGEGIKQAAISINSLATSLLEADQSILFTIIVFNSYATILLHRNSNLSSITSAVNSIRATGGTDFGLAFQEVDRIISGHKEDAYIIFFTDGQDGGYSRQTHMDSLKKKLEQRTASSALHTIGFTASHDARLLADITAIGTTQGTFQYAKDAATIKEAVTSLVDLLAIKTMNVVAKFYISSDKGQLIDRKVFFNEVAPSTYTANIFLPNALLDAKNKAQLSVSVADLSKEYTIDLLATKEEPDAMLTIQLLTAYVTDTLMQLSQELFGQTKRSNEELVKAQAVVKDCDLQIQGLFEQIMKIKLKTRKRELMETVAESSAHIAEFHKALASAMANQLTNDTIAKLNSLAYKKVAKRSLAKRLDQRVEENALLFQKLDSFIEKAVAALNAEKITEKYGMESIGGVGQCMLSCKNWLEAALDADCLCIAINVTRSEAAIADPTQVVVHGISPTFMSADSFLDSVEYALSKAGNSHEETHGGFNKHATTPSVIVGQAREAISAVLPLYISDEHWSIAKHKMKPVMGWVTTLDVLGYTSSQIKAIPFLALAAAAREAFGPTSNAFKLVQYDLIFQTCLQIMRDFSNPESEFNLARDLQSQYTAYISDPAIRTVDIIPNNWIFLMQLHCALHLKLVQPLSEADTEKFILALAEEELRRRPSPFIFNATEADIAKLIHDMLGIDEASRVMPVVSTFKEQTSIAQQDRISRISEFYEAKLKALDEGLPAVLEEGLESIKDCLNFTPDAREEVLKLDESLKSPTFDGKLDALTEKATSRIAEYEQTFNFNVTLLVQMAKRLIQAKDIVVDPATTGFSSLGSLDHHVKLALLIQNAQQYKNADRREAIEKGLYVNPYAQPQAIILRMQTEIVQNLKEKYVREAVTDMTNELSLKVTTYKQKFNFFFADLAAKFNAACIEEYH